MKITDSEVIKSGENDLIDAITAEMDWGAIEEIFKKEHKLEIEEDVQYRRGDIVVHDNEIAYELEFQVNVTLSVLLNREGHCISLTSSGDLEKPDMGLSDESVLGPEGAETEPEEPAVEEGVAEGLFKESQEAEEESEAPAPESHETGAEENGDENLLEEPGPTGSDNGSEPEYPEDPGGNITETTSPSEAFIAAMSDETPGDDEQKFKLS